MAQINGTTDLSNVLDAPTFMRFASALISNICDTVNGQIQFDSNFLSQTVQVAFPTASTDVQVKHHLNKTGVNYIVVNNSAPAVIYNGVTPSNAQQLSLRTNVPCVVTLVLY